MNPFLNSRHTPYIKIQVYLKTNKQVTCLIDTGFSGGLALPERYLKQLSQEPLAYQEFELADGSRRDFAVFEIEVAYGKHRKLVPGIITPSDEALVGIDFLRGFEFTLDLKEFKVFLRK